MRTAPYPTPPSRTWTAVLAATYGMLALAGALVLVALVVVPQSLDGVLVLGFWGATTLAASLLCMFGTLWGRYRYEWMGTWLIVMGTSVYIVITVMGTLGQGPLVTLMSAPTILYFLYGVGLTLTRAVQLSIVDIRARRQVLIEKAATGEIPEVAAHE